MAVGLEAIAVGYVADLNLLILPKIHPFHQLLVNENAADVILIALGYEGSVNL